MVIRDSTEGKWARVAHHFRLGHISSHQIVINAQIDPDVLSRIHAMMILGEIVGDIKRLMYMEVGIELEYELEHS